MKNEWQIAGFMVAVLLFSTGLPAAEDAVRRTGNDWPTVGGDSSNTRYSPLTQIDTHNVGKLSGAWVRELGTKTRTPPVVVNGVLYIVDATKIYALNAKTGESIWEYTPAKSSPARGGVAVAEDKVFCGLADAHVIALDARTGKLAWTGYIGNAPEQSYDKSKQINFSFGAPDFDPKIGFVASAPTYVNGKLVIGLTGGDGGTRSKIAALDAKDGKMIWQWWVVPSRGEPGSETWPADVDATELGGGAVWMHGAADPQLGLVYFGTGNTRPIFGGEVRAGDNLYTASLVVLDVNTGKLKWYKQLTHHDMWEMDVSTPPILYDARIGGRSRKAVAVMRTDGYLFLFDRRSGEPLVPIEERPVKQDARLKTAPTQPYPSATDEVGPPCIPTELMPSGFVSDCYFYPEFYDHPEVAIPASTVRQAPMAFDPRTGIFYVPAGVQGYGNPRLEDPYAVSGGVYQPGWKQYGLVAAIDARTHKIHWQNRSPWSLISSSGVMATAGGLVFRLEGDGNFLALSAQTGEQLWKFQTGYVAGPTVNTLTGGAPGGAYAVDGEEYIVVSMGKGVWAFKLHGNVPERPAPPVPPTEGGFLGIVKTLSVDDEIGIARFQPGQAPLLFPTETSFVPLRAQLPAGQPVSFMNYGIKTHTIVAADNSWTTGPIAPGKSVKVTISKPGKYTYFAKEFPWSKGQLIVQ